MLLDVDVGNTETVLGEFGSDDLALHGRRFTDEEAGPLDMDFTKAIEHGMPPAGRLGIDRLPVVVTDAWSLRDLILFPHHRPEV